jgi:hypothetical protein
MTKRKQFTGQDAIEAIGTKLPTISGVGADPMNALVPSDPHYQYVVASGIAKHIIDRSIADGNIPAYIIYLDRLEPDIAAMAADDITKARPELKEKFAAQ